ncbi:glycosyltransferase family 4 protein [Haladaptatus sp. NG-SE-30]
MTGLAHSSADAPEQSADERTGADGATERIPEGSASELLIVTQHYPPDNSGNASRMADTAKNLVTEGWDVTVLTPHPAFPHGRFDRSKTRKRTTERDEVTVHELWAWTPTTDDPGFASRLGYYLGFALHAALWLLVHGGRYDMAFTSSPPIFTGLCGLVTRLVHRVPWVVDVRDLWIDASVSLGFLASGSVAERASRLFERLVVTVADEVTVTTETLADRLAGRYDVPHEKMTLVPNGVDAEMFSPSSDSDDPLILYTGNVGHAQDIHACLRAMTRLDRDDVELLIVGDGDAKAELQRLTERLGVEDVVTFRGLVDREEVPKLLDRAAIGIAPLKDDDALSYAIPTKVYEYMACELPVLVTGTGEVERILDETGSGVAVESDPDRIATAMERLLSDRERRGRMGENGRRFVLDNYERAVIAMRLSERLEAKLD